MRLTVLLSMIMLLIPRGWAADQRVVQLTTDLRFDSFVVNSLGWSPDGRELVVSGIEATFDSATGRAQISADGAIYVIDLGEGVAREIAKGSFPGQVAFSPDGSAVAGIMGRSLATWSLADGTVIGSGPEGVTEVAYAPDRGVALARLDDGSVISFDLREGKIVQSYPKPSFDGKLVAFASGDPALVDQSGNTLRLRRLDGGEEITLEPWESSKPHKIALSRNGKVLVACDETGSVVAYDLDENEMIGTLSLAESRINSVSVDEEGTAVAFAGRSGAVYLWNPRERKAEISFGEHRVPVLAVVFSQDGRRIGTSAFDGHVKLWAVGPPVDGVALRARDVAVQRVARSTPPVASAGITNLRATERKFDLGQKASAKWGRAKVSITILQAIPGSDGFSMKGYAEWSDLPPKAQKEAGKLGYEPGSRVFIIAGPDGQIRLQPSG